MDLEIIKIAEETVNNRYIKNHTHCSNLKNSLCGDKIQIELIVKKKKIVDFGYTGNLMRAITRWTAVSRPMQFCDPLISKMFGLVPVIA